MQKLVKRKMHYETIIPVEAYHPEDDTWQDDVSLWLTVAGGILARANPWVGAGIAGAGVINHFFHDEIVDGVEAMAEGEVERQNIEQANHDAMHNSAVDVNEAIGDAVIDFVGSIDHDDPIVQLYGE
ncbi:hypothetical protein F4Y93_02365 [Candidatus Poribacteria bacterium]|nr:hypothetical protein [Candidatus Poribacteria bacterium]